MHVKHAYFGINLLCLQYQCNYNIVVSCNRNTRRGMAIDCVTCNNNNSKKKKNNNNKKSEGQWSTIK